MITRSPFSTLATGLLLGLTAALGGCSPERDGSGDPAAPADPPKATPVATPPVAVQDPLEVGRAAFASRGCGLCHATDSKRIQGPGLGGIFGTDRELADGTTVKADEAYLRATILDDRRTRVKGWPPVMPSYASKIGEAEANAIVTYLKSLP